MRNGALANTHASPFAAIFIFTGLRATTTG